MQLSLAFWVILKRNKYYTIINCVNPKETSELKLPSHPSNFTKYHSQRWKLLPVVTISLISASSFLLALCSSSVSMLRSFQTLPLFFYGSFSAFVSLHSQTSKRHYLYNYLYCSLQVLLKTEFFICL